MATKYSDTQKISRRLHFILLMLCIYCSFLTGQKCRMQPLYIFATNYSYNDIFRCQMKCLRWCQSCWKKFRERAVQDSSDKSLEQKLLGQKTKRKRCRRASVDLCVCVCVVEQEHCFAIHMALLSVRRGRCTASRNTDSCICIHNTQIQNVQKFCYLLQNNNGASI